MSTSLRDDIMNAVRDAEYSRTQFTKDVTKILDFGVMIVGGEECILPPEEIAEKLYEMGYRKLV